MFVSVDCTSRFSMANSVKSPDQPRSQCHQVICISLALLVFAFSPFVSFYLLFFIFLLQLNIIFLIFPYFLLLQINKYLCRYYFLVHCYCNFHPEFCDAALKFGLLTVYIYSTFILLLMYKANIISFEV